MVTLLILTQTSIQLKIKCMKMLNWKKLHSWCYLELWILDSFFSIKNTYIVPDANFIFLVATALCSVTCKKGRPLDLESFISLHVLGVWFLCPLAYLSPTTPIFSRSHREAMPWGWKIRLTNNVHQKWGDLFPSPVLEV